MAIIGECTEQENQLQTDQHNFNEYMLDTTGIDGIITPRVPSNLTYSIENCPINDIMKKYVIAANELLYQLANDINHTVENKKNEVNVLLNKGIDENGQIRDNIDAEIAVLNEALIVMKTTFGIFETSNNKLVDTLVLDISKISTGKVDSNTLNHINRSIRKIISKANKKISIEWTLAQNQLEINFFLADTAAVIFSSTAHTPAELKLAIAKVVKTIEKLQQTVELDFQKAENKIMYVQNGAEQEILNIMETICADLMK